VKLLFPEGEFHFRFFFAACSSSIRDDTRMSIDYALA